jgi:cobyrinic acid a,c-diamide synthase
VAHRGGIAPRSQWRDRVGLAPTSRIRDFGARYSGARGPASGALASRVVPILGPRLVVAGTHSGVGKTTVTTGLLAALRAAGHRPAAAKVGPDFIDPGYHALACGRPPRNLDAWLCGAAAVGPLAARAGEGADVLVVEGVMGMFDGATDGTPSSTADVARILVAPVLLVVDAEAMAGSVAAVVHGFATLDPAVDLAGVVLNRVASDGHEAMLREAIAPTGIPVVGALRRDDRLVWRDRHHDRGAFRHGAGRRRRRAHRHRRRGRGGGGSPTTGGRSGRRALPRARRPRRGRRRSGVHVHVHRHAGRAPSRRRRDRAIRPLADGRLPDPLDGLVVGGGFPEVHAACLAGNEPLLAAVRHAVAAGVPTWAECGGLLWLTRSVDGRPMAGIVPATARMTDRLTLGYRQATITVASPLGLAGTRLRGHEFHYAAVDPPGDALDLRSRFGQERAGFASPTLLASFLHHHPGGDPSAVAAFLAACRAPGRRPVQSHSRQRNSM